MKHGGILRRFFTRSHDDKATTAIAVVTLEEHKNLQERVDQLEELTLLLVDSYEQIQRLLMLSIFPDKIACFADDDFYTSGSSSGHSSRKLN